MLNIPYIQDPAHGWAIVKRDLLPKLRLNERQFPFSYKSPKGEFIALEEDCEQAFRGAKKGSNGYCVSI